MYRVRTGAAVFAVDASPQICANLEMLPIEIDPVAMSRVWDAVLELANKHGLCVYDAMSLELAVRMRIPLATLDRALAAARQAAGIDVPKIAQPRVSGLCTRFGNGSAGPCAKLTALPKADTVCAVPKQSFLP